MVKDYRAAKRKISAAMIKEQGTQDRRLLDFLRYRQLWGKKRSDDDISDLAIKQWIEEGKDVSKWIIKSS